MPTSRQQQIVQAFLFATVVGAAFVCAILLARGVSWPTAMLSCGVSAARGVHDRSHLAELVERLRGCGAREVFVNAGDVSQTSG